MTTRNSPGWPSGSHHAGVATCRLPLIITSWWIRRRAASGRAPPWALMQASVLRCLHLLLKLGKCKHYPASMEVRWQRAQPVRRWQSTGGCPSGEATFRDRPRGCHCPVVGANQRSDLRVTRQAVGHRRRGDRVLRPRRRHTRAHPGRLLQALGRHRRPMGRRDEGNEDLPPILQAKAIMPYLPKGFRPGLGQSPSVCHQVVELVVTTLNYCPKSVRSIWPLVRRAPFSQTSSILLKPQRSLSGAWRGSALSP